MKLYYRCCRRITMIVSEKYHRRRRPRSFNSQTATGKYALAEQWVSRYRKRLEMMGDLHILSVYLSIRAPTLDAQIEFEGGRNLELTFGSKALDGSEVTCIELSNYITIAYPIAPR